MELSSGILLCLLPASLHSNWITDIVLFHCNGEGLLAGVPYTSLGRVCVCVCIVVCVCLETELVLVGT